MPAIVFVGMTLVSFATATISPVIPVSSAASAS
jgi:hypothetical protein